MFRLNRTLHMLFCRKSLFALALTLARCASDSRDGSASAAVVDILPHDEAAEWNVPLRLEPLGVMGTDTGEANSSPVFASVGGVIVDERGSVYIDDPRTRVIHILDSTFVYQQSVGHRGSGPGEFMSVYPLLPLSDGRVLAVDSWQHRASWWDPDTQAFTTRRVSDRQFGALVESADSTFVGYIYQPEQAGSPLFAVFENDLSARHYTFGSLAEVRTDTSVLGRRVAQQGTMLMRRSGELLFAPNAYEGTIYAYQIHGNEWRMAKRIRGQPTGTAYERVTGDPDPTTPASRYNVFRHNGQRILYKQFNNSVLLAELPGGLVVHLYLRSEDDSFYPYPRMEVFDRDLRLVAYGRLVIPDAIECDHCFLPGWIDKSGRIYTVAPLEEMTVRAYSLDLERVVR